MQLKKRMEKVRNGRRTLKRSRIQRQKGGAAWPTLVGDKGKWQAALEAAGLWDSVSELFADTHSSTNNSKLMRHYLNAIMMQDELMDVAMKLTREDIGGVMHTVDSIADNIDTIDGIGREEFLKYVIDVQRMGSFTITPADDIEDDEAARSKLETIRKDTSEPNSSLLLFPDRLKNIFIKALATIAIQMKYAEPSIIQNPKLDIEKIATLQSELYTSYTESLAMMTTGRKLRDGFYLDESIGEFRASLEDKKLWLTLIKELRRLVGGERTVSVPSCNTYNTADEDGDFIKFTADILYTYLETDSAAFDVNMLLNKYASNTCTAEQKAGILTNITDTEEQKYLPTYADDLYTTLIEGTTVTYIQLLSHMRPYALNYMIHVCHTIKKLEPSVRAAITP